MCSQELLIGLTTCKPSYKVLCLLWPHTPHVDDCHTPVQSYPLPYQQWTTHIYNSSLPSNAPLGKVSPSVLERGIRHSKSTVVHSSINFPKPYIDKPHYSLFCDVYLFFFFTPPKIESLILALFLSLKRWYTLFFIL